MEKSKSNLNVRLIQINMHKIVWIQISDWHNVYMDIYMYNICRPTCLRNKGIYSSN